MPFPFGTWACEFDCTSLDYIREREWLSELSMMFLRVDIIRVIFPCELGRWLKKRQNKRHLERDRSYKNEM